MSAEPTNASVVATPGPAVTPGELAELLSSFTTVTSRLEQTHEVLRREVARLQRELSDANEQLERSRRLAALGQMAAGIAHEVRNPLGSIRLYAKMLEDDLAGMPAQRSIAGKIAAAVRGLDGVVGDVLSFAREVRVSEAEVTAGELFERALVAGLLPDGPDIRVARDAGEDGVGLRCDPTLVVRALVNVVRNAHQAMAEAEAPPGGHRLTLSARSLPADEHGRRWAALSVRDTGPGISPEVLERMFNPFFTTRATGTGLGLAIVHRLVDAHGGRVAARSEPGVRGATFELILPAAAPRERAGAGAPEISVTPAARRRGRGSRAEQEAA